MTNKEIQDLVNKYFVSEGYKFPTDIVHRYDADSSAVLYSLIRHYKPKVCLEIGTSHGGSTCIISAALVKNGGEFTHIGSEIDNDLRSEAEANCLRITGVTPIMIGDITKNLDAIPKELDMIFVDTDHDLDTTKWIFEHIVPRIKKGGLFTMHDWAVEDIDGKLVGKGDRGVGGWPETDYIMDLLRKKEFPVEKIYWGYKNPAWQDMYHPCESAFWIYKP